jgi:hypothetical protein
MFGEGADRFGEFRTGLDSFGQNAKSHKVALELERLGSIGSLSLGSWSLWKVSADGQRFEEGWADSGRSGRFGTLGKLWSGCRECGKDWRIIGRFSNVWIGSDWSGKACEGLGRV